MSDDISDKEYINHIDAKYEKLYNLIETSGKLILDSYQEYHSKIKHRYATKEDIQKFDEFLNHMVNFIEMNIKIDVMFEEY